MSLDRSLALLFLLVSAVYSYTAFFLMDASLPPFAKLSPVWPSSFPKIIGVISIFLSFILLFAKPPENGEAESDAQIVAHYQWLPAITLLVMMVAYALLLRPIGFIASTILFLVCGAMILGERKMVLLTIVSLICAFGIWYLVQEVLGIYLRPWPWFISGGT